MAVDQLAQVVLDAQRDAPCDHPPRIGERPAHEHRADDYEREHEQRVAVMCALRELMVAGVVAATSDRFDCEAREVGE